MDIHKAHPELFQDYRLKDALIKGLGAGYSDLADQIEQWLCEEGNKVVPLLKQGLDPKGTKEMVRRLRVIESICREKENDYYISLLKNAEKKVREEAIHALRHNKGNTQLLLDLVKTEKGGCKKAAQAALSCMEDPEALNYWKTSVKKKPGTAAAFLVLSESDGIADILAESLETLTERFLLNVRECRDTADADIKAFDILMKALLKKSSPTVINWYRQVCQKDAAGRLDKLTDSKKKQVKFSADCSGIVSKYQYKSPEPFAKMIPHVLTNAMLSSPKQPLLNLAEELFSTEGEDYFKPAFIAGLLSRPSREVYEKFIPYIESSESILSVFYHQILSLIHFDPNSRRFELRLLVEDFVYPGEGSFVFCQPLFEPLGIEWFELIASGRLDKVQTEGPYSLSGLINPSDCRVCEVMGEYFYRQAWAPSVDVERLFCTLDKCGWIGDKCKGIIVAAVKKGFYTKSNRGLNAFWDFFSMVYNAPMTDAQKADEVEEVIELIHSSQAEICNWHDQKMIDWCQKIRDNEKG